MRKKKEENRRREQEVARAILPWQVAKVLKGFETLTIVSLTTSGNLYKQAKFRRIGTKRIISYYWTWLAHSVTKDPIDFMKEKFPTARIIKRRRPVWKLY